MIIFLYGQDSYRIHQKLQEIVSGYKTKNPSGLSMAKIDFAENDLTDFYNAFISESLIPEKKLIILKNVFKADPDRLLEFLKSQKMAAADDVILVAISPDAAKKGKGSGLPEAKLFEYLIKKPNLSSAFEPLKQYEIKNWARRALEASGLAIAGDALDLLVLNCGDDLWKMDSEIKKLTCYKSKGVITRAEIEEMIVPGAEYNAFNLTDALAKKDKKRAVEALARSLQNGEEPVEILGLLAWQIRNLLRFKADPSKISLHPYVLQKTEAGAKLFSSAELAAMLKKISELDLALKTSDINEKTALSLFISEL